MYHYRQIPMLNFHVNCVKLFMLGCFTPSIRTVSITFTAWCMSQVAPDRYKKMLHSYPATPKPWIGCLASSSCCSPQHPA